MARPVKIVLVVFAAIAALLAIAVVSFVLLFDPNDFRDRIAAETKRSTGRDLTIEGDLEVSLFPWLAIGMGRTSLGNAQGFGDEPFASFEQARLSVRLLPLLLRREIIIGTAELDSLHLNLAVRRDGSSNWDDLVAAEEAGSQETGGRSAALDIASIDVSNASLIYNDAQAGERYTLTDINMKSGRVSRGDPVPLAGELSFRMQPDEISGSIELETTARFDTDASTITLDDLSVDGLVEGFADVPTTLEFKTPKLEANTERQMITLGPVEMSVLGVDIAADVEPFSYAGELQPVAKIEVDAFSPRSVMQRLNIEVPETADPNALGKAYFDARARVSRSAVALSDLNLVFDDTRLKGQLSVPRDETGSYRFDLDADSIDLNRYMAPDSDPTASGGAASAPTEIPVDLLRPINARGSLRVAEAYLGALKFEAAKLELNTANGRLRLNPFTATLYEGTYSGDVRLDVSGALPVLSVDENVSGVRLGALALAMFDQKRVTGAINGSFKLSGRGADMDAVQKSLAGSMSMELLDGAFEGTDVWYELRRARALFKQQPAPQPVLPARTKFSTVKASGPVVDGVFQNNDLRAELPFMQITGTGTVDFAAATLDYRMTARVLEKPEFAKEGTAEELAEFTQAVIPLRISGPLTKPSIKPDIEGMLKAQIREKVEERKEEVKKRLVDKLLGGREEPPAEGDAAAPDAADAPDAPEEEEEDLEDQLKKSLKDIFNR